MRNNIPKKSGIYRIVNLVNGKCYVGHASNLRARKAVHFSKLKNNKHGNQHLQDSFNLYGESNFIFEVLEIIEFPSDFSINRKKYRKYLCPYEQKWIDFYNSSDGNYGYNEVPSAENSLGYIHKSETKIKMSKNHADVSGINNPMYGVPSPMTDRKHIPESIDKMKKAQLGEKHWNYGQHQTEESNLKRRLALLGEKSPRYGKPNCTKRYILYSPDKDIYACKNNFRFCKEYKLRAAAMINIAKGRHKTHRGWTCRYMTEEEIELYEPLLQGDIFWVILDYIIKDND